DVAPAKFGLGNLLTTSASDYVAQTQTYGSPFRVNCGSPGSLAGVAARGNGTTCGRSDFFGVGFNTRFGRGIQLGGGVDTGRTATTTVPVPLIPPMTVFLPRRTQLDLRLTKTVRLGPKARLQANVDIYNALNGSSLIAANSTYGPRWLQPASDNAIGGVDPILPGRLFQFGGRMTF